MNSPKLIHIYNKNLMNNNKLKIIRINNYKPNNNLILIIIK
jgi:hypothetical protein